ncbi:MAG: tetratricopeptide repeat protein [Pseudomonadota bacterium]
MHFLFTARPWPQETPTRRWSAWKRPLAGALAGVLLAGPVAWSTTAHAQAKKSQSQVVPLSSGMDAGMFYQLLMGEMTVQSGDIETSFQLMLDAARKTKNEALFQRATDIALQARAGEQALAAARAWQAALPESSVAHRYVIELLVALGRPAEAMEPMSALLKLSSPAERLALIASTPRLLTGAPQPQAVATQLQQTLQPYLDAPDTRVAAHVTLGRIWLVADKTDRALDYAQRAQKLDPQSEAPALLAVELISSQPAALAVVDNHLLVRPDNVGLRLVYARALTLTQRYNEAIAQLNVVTLRQPQLPAPWLTLGALHVEMRHPKEALVALQTHLDRLDQPASAGTGVADPAAAGRSAVGAGTTPLEDATASIDPGASRQQAWLLMAEAADQLGDSQAAQDWLSKVDDPKLARDVVQRRVQILARQGKVAEARRLIQRLSDSQADDRTKVLLETLVLREAKRWGEAQKVLSAANQRLSNDTELLYEQAMVEEKLNRLSDMERLLRKVIELKPDHHHAHNALGYSWAERNMRLPEAKALIQRALELAPADPFITDSLAWVEYRLGNRDEAVRLLRQAFRLRPDPEIGTHLAEVLWVTGQREEARRLFRDSRKRDAQNEVLRETLTRLRVEL